MLSLNMTIMTAMAVATDNDIAANQLLLFRERNLLPVGTLTTTAGAPVSNSDAGNTLNSRLFFNEFFMDITTHLVRERIPERVVHAKGAGAHGYFEVTHDISDICKAKLFSKEKKITPIIVRFSPAVQVRGGSDTVRDIRGFATKFYTEEGNFDLIGINMPVYVYNDPRLFTTFAHSQKPNPATNLLDPNTYWDFLTLQPESMFMYMYVLGDPGIPDGYRHMPGYPIHTYQVENERGDVNFVRFHILPDAGIRNIRSEDARRINSLDYDYNTRDLYNAIGNGEFPSWTLSVQVLSPEDVKSLGYDVFDVTRIIPLDQFPLREVGRLVLNRNVANYFAEVEQLAFSPANLVPGILGGPDILFEARRFVYRNAQYHRLGTNYNNILVNCPFRTKTSTYLRDSVPPVGNNQRDVPNYYPNSFNGPMPYYVEDGMTSLIKIVEKKPDNFDQATNLYVNGMTDDERSRMIENMLASLRSVAGFIQEKTIKILTKIHPDFGDRIYKGLIANETLKFLKTEEIAE